MSDLSEIIKPFLDEWTGCNGNRSVSTNTSSYDSVLATLSWYGIALGTIHDLSGEPCVRIPCLDTTPYSLRGSTGGKNLGTMIGITDRLEDIIQLWPEHEVDGETMYFCICGHRYGSVTLQLDIRFWMDNSDGADFTSSTYDYDVFLKFSKYMHSRIAAISAARDAAILSQFKKLPR